ncbi:phosphotransferase [Microbacterium esteraromaticum]|uniref:phosphotransferase n=1 Tax=Microbacterium esteraromaticum TaxID=57043 RepID=UPI001CD4BD1E|nr:phosphotransferase [Microbacterium esteraromaticum]MCA1307875.1 phosphotransferase [Microbacterium esteraromaticum]
MTVDARTLVQRLCGPHARIERTFEGFYAKVHVVDLGDGSRRVVKCFHRRGIAEGEARALARLASATPSGVAVPRVLQVELGGEPETIVQTYVDGTAVADVEIEASDARDALAEQIIDLVDAWSAHRGEAFEDRQGRAHERFAESFRSDVAVLSAWLRTAEGEEIAADVREGLHATVTLIDDLLAPLGGDPPVFIHDDCHAGNFLVDDDGARCGVIDPGAARFSHREMDLFHLADAAPQLELWNRAAARHPLPAGGEARRLLFSLWDDVSHARLAGWRDDDWFRRKLDAFDGALRTPTRRGLPTSR